MGLAREGVHECGEKAGRQVPVSEAQQRDAEATDFHLDSHDANPNRPRLCGGPLRRANPAGEESSPGSARVSAMEKSAVGVSGKGRGHAAPRKQIHTRGFIVQGNYAASGRSSYADRSERTKQWCASTARKCWNNQ
ncbi:unnamed protein product [Amoebophrya sp. A120]|nr:unnamed protein product [Amoebophrya sp. A120]|eukprot:GSA120T00006340001.1